MTDIDTNIASSLDEALTDRELVHWAVQHGWHYFHSNGQLRSPRCGHTAVDDWDRLPSHIRTQIREQLQAACASAATT